MSAISTTVATTIQTPRDDLFDWFIPVDLADILLGYGPLPRVIETTDQTGRWDRPGASRTVHLADGTTALEEVTDCKRPAYFAYRVRNFTNLLRPLVREARGQWWFEEDGRASKVRWSYTFYARSHLAGLVLFPIVKLLWRGYMRVGIRATKTLGEKRFLATEAA